MKYLLTLLTCIFFVGMTFATQYTLSGTIDPMQALTNMGNTGNGTGTISGTFDDVTKELNYTLTWENLTAPISNAHFHLGAPGVSGGVQLGIPGPWTSPYVRSLPLNMNQELNLLAGNWYVNIHTTAFGGGEIRGQVIVQKPVIPTMGQWALMIFGLLLASIAVVYVKKRSTSIA